MADLDAVSSSTAHNSNAISYGISKDPVLLEQYYQLRDKEYHDFLHIEGNIAKEDFFDRGSVICLATADDRVIGGARLTIIPAHSLQLLPMEEHGFILKEILPELQLDTCSYCEISRFVVHPDFRTGQLNLEITRQLITHAKEQHCTYHFSIAPRSTSINSRRIGKIIGVEHHILKSIKIPYKPIYKELNEKGIYLSCTILFPDINDSLTTSLLQRSEYA